MQRLFITIFAATLLAGLVSSCNPCKRLTRIIARSKLECENVQEFQSFKMVKIPSVKAEIEFPRDTGNLQLLTSNLLNSLSGGKQDRDTIYKFIYLHCLDRDSFKWSFPSGKSVFWIDNGIPHGKTTIEEKDLKVPFTSVNVTPVQGKPFYQKTIFWICVLLLLAIFIIRSIVRK